MNDDRDRNSKEGRDQFRGQSFGFSGIETIFQALRFLRGEKFSDRWGATREHC